MCVCVCLSVCVCVYVRMRNIYKGWRRENKDLNDDTSSVRSDGGSVRGGLRGRGKGRGRGRGRGRGNSPSKTHRPACLLFAVICMPAKSFKTISLRYAVMMMNEK